MPKINHPNIGNIAKTKYITGVIIEITDNDTCTVSLPGKGNFNNIPIYYHCSEDVDELSNGALEGGSGAFATDDVVIVQNLDGLLRVIGHADGVKRPCGAPWLYQLAIAGPTVIDPLDLESMQDLYDEIRPLNPRTVVRISLIRFTLNFGFDQSNKIFDLRFLHNVSEGTFEPDGNVNLNFLDTSIPVEDFGTDIAYDPTTNIFKFPSAYEELVTPEGNVDYWLLATVNFIFDPGSGQFAQEMQGAFQSSFLERNRITPGPVFQHVWVDSSTLDE